MLLRAIFLVFGASVVCSVYGKSINPIKEINDDFDKRGYFKMQELEKCSKGRKEYEKWWKVKEVTGENPLQGICSWCQCTAERKEYCEDHGFTCFPIPGCIEYEKKSKHCCPKCKRRTRKKIATEEVFTISVTEAPTPPPPPFPFVFGDTDEDKLKVKS